MLRRQTAAMHRRKPRTVTFPAALHAGRGAESLKWAGGGELRARRVPRNGQAGVSVKVASSSAGFARAAVLGQNVYVAWTDQNAVTKRVHVSRVRF